MLFFGEYHCTVDEKGRIKLPVDLKRQFPLEDQGVFIMAKGLDDCVMIYPLTTWKRHEDMLSKLDRLKADHRQFIASFTAGLTRIETDQNDRFVLPKQLMKYLNFPREVVLHCDADQIQVWDVNRHEQFVQDSIKKMDYLSESISDFLEQKTKKD